MIKLSIKQISLWLGIQNLDSREIEVVAVDSRLCKKTTLYVALKGEREDGHDYLRQAAENGAIAAIVSSEYQKDSFGLFLLRVEDPLKGLQLLAKQVIREVNPLIIGITGSVGKTTVKEFIATLLEDDYKVFKTPSSFNGQIGLPLTILNGNFEAKVWVLEMGMSSKNEMDKLIDIAPCHVSVVTRVAPAHYGYFNSIEEIAHEKAKILSSPSLRRGFIHHMNERFHPFKQKKEKLISSYKVPLSLTFTLPFSESHLIENFFVAALVASYLGVSDETIQKKTKDLKSASHRFEKHRIGKYPGALIIDDAYNSNPVALKTIFQNLPNLRQKGKSIGVIGEMRELGSLSVMAHKELGMLAAKSLDVIFCFGEETKPLYEMFKKSGKEAFHYLDKSKLTQNLLHIIEDGDLILIKGSNSNKLWEVLDLLKEMIVSI